MSSLSVNQILNFLLLTWESNCDMNNEAFDYQTKGATGQLHRQDSQCKRRWGSAGKNDHALEATLTSLTIFNTNFFNTVSKPIMSHMSQLRCIRRFYSKKKKKKEAKLYKNTANQKIKKLYYISQLLVADINKILSFIILISEPFNND